MLTKEVGLNLHCNYESMETTGLYETSSHDILSRAALGYNIAAGDRT